MNHLIEALEAELFAGRKAQAYVILDGASVPDLLDRLDRDRPAYECLYRGELAPDLAEVAPYLVKLERGSEFAEWVIAHGWGMHWGIFVVTTADLRQLRQHFRRFLTVHDSDGKPLYFRCYDPRVLRAFLPTCTAEELADLFGPVTAFVMEGDEPEVRLRFRLAEGSLARDEAQMAGGSRA